MKEPGGGHWPGHVSTPPSAAFFPFVSVSPSSSPPSPPPSSSARAPFYSERQSGQRWKKVSKDLRGRWQGGAGSLDHGCNNQLQSGCREEVGSFTKLQPLGAEVSRGHYVYAGHLRLKTFSTSTKSVDASGVLKRYLTASWRFLVASVTLAGRISRLPEREEHRLEFGV